MRMRSPTSRGSFRIRFSVFDTLWAAATPLLALYIRDALILSYEGAQIVIFYCVVSLVFSLIAFLIFRIRDGMSGYFSVHDALNVAKAVLLSELLTTIVLFTVTRLDGVPRSTPVIHALLLAAGLIAARTIIRLCQSERQRIRLQPQTPTENVIIIGATRLSDRYIELLHICYPDRRKVVAVLDDDPAMHGRAIAGVLVMGPPRDLESLIEEFVVHGTQIGRVSIGGEPNILARDATNEITRVCTQRSIVLDSVPQLLGFSTPPAAPKISPYFRNERALGFSPPQYFQTKRYIDFCAAVILLPLVLPLMLLLAAMVLLDVGSPVLFWQRRVGMNGREFELQKFRSLKWSSDEHDQRVQNTERLSWFGRLLRRSRLDELPQLAHVLVGDMSLIGPRPLLPMDQPASPAVRLSVRPGITGWAQVNGGNMLTPDEKNALDEWYIRNASARLDFLIILMTVRVALGGGRQNEPRPDNPALSAAKLKPRH